MEKFLEFKGSKVRWWLSC